MFPTRLQIESRLSTPGAIVREGGAMIAERHGQGVENDPLLSALNSGCEIALDKLSSAALERFCEIDYDQTHPTRPFWNNLWFPTLDAISLCLFLESERPLRYVEVGSGNSTRFARWWIDKLRLPTRIVSIDPAPRAEIDALCDEMFRCPLEEVDLSDLALGKQDLLFIDSSHVATPGSDVDVVFKQMLPVLPRGVVYGLHDIFLPRPYPQDWEDRHYNEQDVLADFIRTGAMGSRVEFPVHHLCDRHTSAVNDAFRPLIQKGVWPGGASMMMRR